MATETNLNVAPYFDDFDETKNYHRILFKPINAVQTRELNQLQTILQNQIERFGNSIYKDGAVINGCGVQFHDNLPFVRLADHVANGELVDVTSMVGLTVESPATGLKASILTVMSGSEQSYPWTNRLYVKYMNSGSLDDVQYKVFRDGEALNVFKNPRSANSLLTTVYGFTNNERNIGSIGVGYGLGVSDGMIYQKGFFIRTEAQTVVVSDTVNPGNAVVGFITNESIVTSDQDSSLHDNALGYVNMNAPGADRLKLTANLTVIHTNDIPSTSNFTSIVQYIGGIPAINNSDSKYSAIGDEMARRGEETNGSFVIKPFKVNTVGANASHIVAQVSAGSGYAQGHRVELIKTAPITIRRGTDTASIKSQLVTTNYGNYVLVNDVVGTFAFDKLQEVYIYDQPQRGATNRGFAATGPTGNLIGVANLRSIKKNSGIEGTPSAQYEFYLFNIRMNAGANFGTQAKGIRYTGETTALADIVTINGQNLFNSERRAMLWKFGTNAVKTLKDGASNINTSYVLRQKTNTTLAVNGLVSVTLTTQHAGGTNQFPYGDGVLGDGRENDFMVVTHAYTQTASLGTVNVSGTTVTGGNHLARLSVGEYVNLNNAEVRRIVAMTNTTLTLDAAATTGTGVVLRKAFPAGYVFPLSDLLVGTRTVTIGGSSTTATINTGINATGVNLEGAVGVSVYHNVLRFNAVPAKKTVLKNVYVKIDTATHPSGNVGPWSLGLTDVHQLRKVTVDTTFNENASDISTLFYFDPGQRDTHYDLALLALRPGQSIPAGSKIVVKLDMFVQDTTPGVGFFTVDSYPVNDGNPDGASNIATADIPVYVSDAGVSFSLRDCVDFRPYKVNVGNLATTIADATINPVGVTNFFNLDTVGTYCPAPDETFSTDLTYYLGRKESIYFSNRGFIKTLSGSPATNPVSPQKPADGMAIAVLTIPPFPSLSSEEMSVVATKNRQVYQNVRDTGYRVATQIVTNKRYRMDDIATLDARLSRVEYYATLNMLEQATTSLQVPDANGLNRFKNGIFVDPFTNFTLADVSNPEFRIAIDAARGIVRPFFNEERPELEFNATSSTGVVQNSRLITLPFNTVPAIAQPFATGYRSAASVQFKWTGSVSLFPAYGHNIDKVAEAAVNVTLDLATPWQDFANSPHGMSWGDWRVTNVDTAVVGSTTTSSTEGRTTTETTTTTLATTTTSSRDGQKLNVARNTSTYNLGTYVEDITIQPYIASVEVAFYAWGMRPSTIFYPFFEDELVAEHCAPGVRNTAITDTSDHNYVTRTAPYGTALKSDENGVVYGKFLIPAGKYRVGDRSFRLADRDNVKRGAASITSSASTTYTASNFAVTKGSTTLTTVNPTVQFTSLADSSATTTSSSQNSVKVTISPEPPVVPVKDNPTPIMTSDPDLTKSTPDPVPDIIPPLTPTVDPAPTHTTPCGTTFFLGDLMSLAATYTEVFGAPYSVDDISKIICFNGLESFSNVFVPLADPLAQMIRVEIDNGTTGMYIPEITVFFKGKSTNAQTGVTLYVVETLNGYPDGSKVLPFSRTHLNWNQVNVSDSANVGTTFKFEAPVFLANGRQYAFIVLPDGGDPDYTLWTAILGDTDVTTGVQVSSKPYIDTAFYSSNQTTWSALQDEYVKFVVGRCSFPVNQGVARFTTAPMDYMNLTNVISSNNATSIRVGDEVYGSNGNLPLARGVVTEYYPANNFIKIAQSTGTFGVHANIEVHRPLTQGGGINLATRIATAGIAKIENVRMNAMVPRFATIAPAGTAITLGFRSCSNTYVVDATSTNCSLESETELFDYERIVPSRSNEVTFAAGNKLMSVDLKMTTDNSYLSPAIDVIRSNFLAIGNIIDSTMFDLNVEKYSNNGSAKNKYLSKVITLADGQDSEDLRIYLTAYKPVGTKVAVFAKFLNGEDADSITSKVWTQLDIDDDTIASDYRNTSDYRELLYTVPTTLVNQSGYAAFINGTDGVTYIKPDGSVFSGYKSFQIKIVLLSDSTAVVPRLNDVRGLALLL